MTAQAQRGSDPDAGTYQTRRKFAEWVSVGVSALLIVAIVGFLVYQATKTESEFIAIEAKLLLDKTQQREGWYILPMEIQNKGDHTLRDAEILVKQEKAEDQKIKIEYLGEHSTQTIYLYFKHDPGQHHVEAVAQHYRLD